MFTFISVVDSRSRIVVLVVYLIANKLCWHLWFQQEVLFLDSRLPRFCETSEVKVVLSARPARLLVIFQTTCWKRTEEVLTPAFSLWKLWGSDVVYGTACPPGAFKNVWNNDMPPCQPKAAKMWTAILLACWLPVISGPFSFVTSVSCLLNTWIVSSLVNIIELFSWWKGLSFAKGLSFYS